MIRSYAIHLSVIFNLSIIQKVSNQNELNLQCQFSSIYIITVYLRDNSGIKFILKTNFWFF